MAIAHIQSREFQASPVQANSASIAYSSNVQASTLLSVLVAVYDGTLDDQVNSTTGVISDTRGNAWTRRVLLDGVSGGNSAMRLAIYTAVSNGAGACTVTINPGGSSTFIGGAVAEYSGVDTTTPVHTSATGTGTSAAPATGNLVTSVTTAYIAIVSSSSDLPANVAAAGSATNRIQSPSGSSMAIATSDRGAGGTALTAGTYTASWTMSASREWGAVAIALTEGAGGGGVGAEGAAVHYYRQMMQQQ